MAEKGIRDDDQIAFIVCGTQFSNVEVERGENGMAIREVYP